MCASSFTFVHMDEKVRTVSLLLGSNVGNRSEQLQMALARLANRVGRLVRHSAVYETQAWGKQDQPVFLNMAVLIETLLDPHELLSAILAIELDMGRLRTEKWGARTIDIDILLYDELLLSDSDLSIPHPELHNRRFALTPLHEVAPDLIHPRLGKTIAELLFICPDPLAVAPYHLEAHE